MASRKVKAELACVVLTTVDEETVVEVTVALVVIILFVSIVVASVALEFTNANAELDGVLSTGKKLIDVDKDVGVVVGVNVKVVLLFGNELLDVAAGAFGFTVGELS